MHLILQKAKEDERIRAVTMEGSRSNANAVHDEYSDFDICYYVTDIREFTNQPEWIRYFGEILIVQCPDDWYDHPYDYQGHERFAYLIQLEDGNRIDLSLVDIRNMEKERENREPRTVLLNKDHFDALIPVDHERAFYIQKPSEKEYADTCNEFRWVSLYVTKGLCRDEFYYARHCYDLVMDMMIRMLQWKIGVEHEFQVTTGSYGKYMKRFLSEAEMQRFRGIFPDGTYADIWVKLFRMYDYFAENAQYVAAKLGYSFDEDETQRVRGFLMHREEAYRKREADSI